MAVADGTETPMQRHAWATAWRRSPVSLRVGLVILVAHLVIAAVGWMWTPYGYARLGTGIPLSGMSWQHPFGVDQLGRDVFSRVLFGSHVDILLSLSGALLGLAVGAVLGLLSGYLRGFFDGLLQRLNETLIAIPF